MPLTVATAPWPRSVIRRWKEFRDLARRRSAVRPETVDRLQAGWLPWAAQKGLPSELAVKRRNKCGRLARRGGDGEPQRTIAENGVPRDGLAANAIRNVRTTNAGRSRPKDSTKPSPSLDAVYLAAVASHAVTHSSIAAVVMGQFIYHPWSILKITNAVNPTAPSIVVATTAERTDANLAANMKAAVNQVA